MTKKELAAELAKRINGISVAKANEILNALFDAHDNHGIIPAALNRGEKVTIPGFGTFRVKLAQEQTKRIPTSNTAHKIPPRRYVRFKPGKTLKELVIEPA